jgi:hypothetical protein
VRYPDEAAFCVIVVATNWKGGEEKETNEKELAIED